MRRVDDTSQDIRAWPAAHDPARDLPRVTGMTRILAIAGIALLPMTLHAQGTSVRQPNQVTVDASIAGASVGYAANVATDRWVGVQLGVGGDWLNRTVAGG